MKEIQKIELDGQTYYYINNNFVDETYCTVPEEIKRKLAMEIFGKMNYESFSKRELSDAILRAKRVGAYAYVIKMATYGIDKFISSERWVTYILPVLTSSYREMGRPDQAVNVAKECTSKVKCASAQLCTSLASAYCDLGDYDRAKKFIDKAYAMQGGGVGFKNEISLVYKRIEKATK